MNSNVIQQRMCKQAGIHYNDPVQNLPLLFTSEVESVVKSSVPMNIYSRLSVCFQPYLLSSF